jgi:hypothetical protein
VSDSSSFQNDFISGGGLTGDLTIYFCKFELRTFPDGQLVSYEGSLQRKNDLGRSSFSRGIMHDHACRIVIVQIYSTEVDFCLPRIEDLGGYVSILAWV